MSGRHERAEDDRSLRKRLERKREQTAVTKREAGMIRSELCNLRAVHKREEEVRVVVAAAQNTAATRRTLNRTPARLRHARSAPAAPSTTHTIALAGALGADVYLASAPPAAQNAKNDFIAAVAKLRRSADEDRTRLVAARAAFDEKESELASLHPRLAEVQARLAAVQVGDASLVHTSWTAHADTATAHHTGVCSLRPFTRQPRLPCGSAVRPDSGNWEIRMYCPAPPVFGPARSRAC
jgi:hypothetical protein